MTTRGHLRARAAGHHVADFNNLDDLIAHARGEGATHTSGEGAHTKIYFPRGGQYKYEEATVWRKESFWHAQGPGSRSGVSKLPSDARSIGAQLGRRAAEVHASGDTIRVAPGIEIRRMGTIERGRDYRLVDGWAVFVRGAERQPWLPKSEALRQAKAISREGNRVEDYEAIDRRDRVIAGPFKSYGDAKDAAGPAGAVRFVPSRGKPSKATEVQASSDKTQAAFRRLDHFFGSPSAQKKGFQSEDEAAASAATLLAAQMRMSYGTALKVVHEWYRQASPRAPTAREASRSAHRPPVDRSFAGYDFTTGPDGTRISRKTIDTRTPGDHGADPVGDGTFRMVPSGDIVDHAERNRRLARFKR